MGEKGNRQGAPDEEIPGERGRGLESPAVPVNVEAAVPSPAKAKGAKVSPKKTRG